MSFEGQRVYILERRFCSVVSELQLPEGVVALFRSIKCGGNVIHSIDVGCQTCFNELGQWSSLTS
jgi:hypothetical protein